MNGQSQSSEIEVRIRPVCVKPWAWVVLPHVLLPTAVFAYALGGAFLAAGVIVVGTILWMSAGPLLRFHQRQFLYERVTLDAKGMTFQRVPAGKWRRSTLEFTWDEVKRVRPVWNPLQPESAALLILLNRRQRFWTLDWPAPNRVLLDASCWHRQDVRAFLLEHVPAQPVHSRVAAFSMRRAQDRQDRRLRVTLIASAATMVAALVMVVLGFRRTAGVVEDMTLRLYESLGVLDRSFWVRYYFNLYGWRVALLACGVLWVFTTLFFTLTRIARRTSCAGRMIWSMPVLCVIGWPAAVILALLRGYPPIETGWLGASAMGMTWAAILARGRIRRMRWRYAAAGYLLCGAGFAAGWYGYGGVPSSRVVCGFTSSMVRPWTPDGSAFIVEEYKPLSSDDGPDPLRRLRWFSADLDPGPSFTFKRWASIRGVGPAGALCVEQDGEWHNVLWLLPRRETKAVELLRAYDIYEVEMSPSCTRAIMAVVTEEPPPEQEPVRQWHVVDMNTRTIRRLDLPVQPETVLRAGIRDDGTVLWLTGSEPKPEANDHKFNYFYKGKFHMPDEPFAVWAWRPGQQAKPRTIFRARGLWSECRLAPRFERIYGRPMRIGQKGKTEYESEYVEADLTGTPTVERLSTQERYEGERRDSSPDGRFRVWRITTLLGTRVIIQDARTGKGRHVRHCGEPALLTEGPFSPHGRRLLVSGREITRTPWNTDFREALIFQNAVRIVDLDDF